MLNIYVKFWDLGPPIWQINYLFLLKLQAFVEFYILFFIDYSWGVLSYRNKGQKIS